MKVRGTTMVALLLFLLLLLEVLRHTRSKKVQAATVVWGTGRNPRTAQRSVGVVVVDDRWVRQWLVRERGR
jgi:flagellar biogenesis protein FliO